MQRHFHFLYYLHCGILVNFDACCCLKSRLSPHPYPNGSSTLTVYYFPLRSCLLWGKSLSNEFLHSSRMGWTRACCKENFAGIVSSQATVEKTMGVGCGMKESFRRCCLRRTIRCWCCQLECQLVDLRHTDFAFTEDLKKGWLLSCFDLLLDLNWERAVGSNLREY
jgi:hypothetical protein